jgi:general stress protein 26
MTAAECREFLKGCVRTASFAPVRADDAPYVISIWLDLDGGTLFFTAGEGTAKGRSMARDSRMSLCSNEEDLPFHFVPFIGTAELTADDPDLFTGPRA